MTSPVPSPGCLEARAVPCVRLANGLGRLMFCLAFGLLTQNGSAQLGKGHQILLERGLQVQGMVTPDDVFHLSTYTNAHFTSLNWLWTSSPAQMGSAPGFPWARWVQHETNMPPQAGEAPFLSQLVMLQLADEWPLNDDATRTRAVNWFNAVRDAFPGTILAVNNYGGQVSDAALGDFITRARPDMICFDTYSWRSDYTTRDPIGGPPTTWYSELRRYRQWGINANLPFGAYVQTFHAVQDYDQTVYRDPSPSELRLNHFAALAFNAKTLTGFTYNTGASSLFTTPGGDSNPTALYSELADINRRVVNLGKSLVCLKPIADVPSGDQHTTSLMLLRGKNAAGTPNPIPIGFLADPQAPNSYTDWDTAYNNDPYLRGWVVTNKGTKNNGQPGDVLIAWFKPLDESFDGPAYSNEVYMMVVNGLTDPTGTAADCQQEIKLNFLNSFTSVEMLDSATGQVQTNLLPVVSTRRQLVLNLNGGDAALFKFADGAPFVGRVTPQPARLNLQLQTNTLRLTVQGTAGARYQLQATEALPGAPWTILTNLFLPSSNYLFWDTAAASTRLYRAMGAP